MISVDSHKYTAAVLWGHDFRYAINSAKLEAELGWKPEHDFDSGLRETVRWYLENTAWVENVRSGAYRQWIAENYTRRDANGQH